MPLQLPNPPPSSANARNTMRANRGSNTGPERTVRAALRAAGLSGYRLNWRQAPGRPDIAYPGRKVAIFVHGCFWHRCPRCNLANPRAHSDFWARKFELNVQRDARKRAQLEEAGWLVLEIWECDVRERLPESVERVAQALRPGRAAGGRGCRRPPAEHGLGAVRGAVMPERGKCQHMRAASGVSCANTCGPVP